MSAIPSSRQDDQEAPIASDARALRDRLVSGADHSFPSAPAAPTTLAEARSQRRELYVLLAVCAAEVVDDFISAVPPSDVPRADAGVGQSVSANFHDCLAATFDRFFEEHANWWRDGGRYSSIAPALARIDEIGPQVSAVLDRPRFHYAESLLHAGVSSMAPVAPAVLSAVAQLAARDATPAQLVVIALRSASVPIQLAALDLGSSSALRNHLIDHETLGLDPSRIALRGESGEERLVLGLGPLTSSSGSSREALPAAYNHRIGCPSLVRLKGASALQRLWEWTVEAASQSGYLAALAR